MASKEHTTIGSNIRRIREHLGYTQDELANYLKIQRPMISYFETGERACNIDILEKIANLFNVDLAVLFEEEESSKTLNYIFAFRTNQLSPSDLESIADFQTIVKNYLKMKNIANGKG